MELIKPGRVIDFMGMRRFWIGLSLFLTISSIILMFKPGPKYGLDFKGGTELTVRFERRVDQGDVRRSLSSHGHGSAEIVPSATDPRQMLIRVEAASVIDTAREGRLREAVRRALGDVQLREFRMSQGGDHLVIQLGAAKTEAELETLLRSAGVDVRAQGRERIKRIGDDAEHRYNVSLVSLGDQIFSQLTTDTGAGGELIASVWVSPKASEKLRNEAIKALLYSLVFIMIYVAFRFDLRFAPGGILALFHDAVVVIGVFVIFRREVSIATVAAILTVVGYSMNDTIIVYDRVRENLGKRRGLKMLDVINVSISETFSRTLVTSATVILSVLPFAIMGSEVIQNFAIAMIVGVLAGTYSSIYVATPLTEWIDSKFFHPATQALAAAATAEQARFEAKQAAKKSESAAKKSEPEAKSSDESEASEPSASESAKSESSESTESAESSSDAESSAKSEESKPEASQSEQGEGGTSGVSRRKPKVKDK
ncbi:MAG: protein translocase subunit SecF [Myxococcales bacterium]|nr:protein translocase subunit SecF [Myxococcales bacterium]